MTEKLDLEGDSREAYLSYLEARVKSCFDDAERRVLESCIEAAAAFDRSTSTLGTLARLVRACDAIVSGEAAVLAAEMRFETHRLRPGRTPLTAQNVDAYVRLRALVDKRARRATSWTGPRRETIARTWRHYMDVRQDAYLAKPRPSPGSRARRVEEIIGSINSPEARQDLRSALEQGRIAERKLALLRKGIETNFPNVNLDALMQTEPRDAPTAKPQASDRKILALVRRKLQDPAHLRHFGLQFDGQRIKLSAPPGTPLLDKEEWSALNEILSGGLG